MDDSSRKRLHDDAFNYTSPEVENKEDCLSNVRSAAVCSPQNVEVEAAAFLSSEKALVLPSIDCSRMTSRQHDGFVPPIRQDVTVAPGNRESVEPRMVRPPSPVSVASPFRIQHLCTTTDVDRVGRALVHRTRCKRKSCEVCRSVDSLLVQVRDHKRRGCSGHGCNFCRKWTVVLHRNKKRFALCAKKSKIEKRCEKEQCECKKCSN